MSETVFSRLQATAQDPDDGLVPAILAPGRPPLDHGALHAHVTASSRAFRALGIGREDRVALVVPNGPEAATAFLSTAAAAVAAPLNPAYRAEEHGFYLEDLGARAVVVDRRLDTPVREVAARLGVPVLDLVPRPWEPGGQARSHAGDGEAAGPWRLEGEEVGPPSADALEPRPEEPALVLHTSGTTARPKQVPLTHGNLAASAVHIGATLRLTAADRCLNVMPLFHIHGLVAATLASLRAGGGVVCTPGLALPDFFDWLRAFGATWYTAVPTMHQAILRAAADAPGRLAGHALRFARSSSSALPTRTLAELEERLGVPVVEAYGMTEAAHQMASNPLPPGARKPGSVGPAAGPEVAVMDGDGRLRPTGRTGEVVIRGPNVTAGYVANPEANRIAFTNGWFRTGDQGHLDDDGYLFLTGRLKEQINRGGEKISPLEIDDVLTDHPAVAQALAFAVPHATLGEDVAAVVVLREGEEVTADRLRAFAGTRLSAFKVPGRILFMDALPKGATGKPRRIGLAERLGMDTEAPAPEADPGPPPATPVEEIVAALWEEVLGHPPRGVNEDFVAAGGNSLLAAQLVARVNETLRVQLPVSAFFEAPTVRGVADGVGTRLGAPPAAGADR